MATSYKSEISSYYSNCTINPNIDNLKFRHFRFVEKNTFIKIKQRVRNKSDLVNLLRINCPDDAYYSVSCFINPHFLGPKNEKGATFLKSDLVFDLDSKSLNELDKIRIKTIELLDFLDEREIKVKYLAFSGSKGFHVVCESNKINEPSPENRECLYLENHKSIANEILRLGIPIDAKVTSDTRRILRIPGSINSKTGRVCTILERSELEMPIKEIFKKIKQVYIPAPRIPLLGNDITSSMVCTIFGWLNRIGARSPSYIFSTFITSCVNGTKLSILILKHDRNAPLKRILSELQQTYLLPNFYLFKYGNSIFSICFKPLQNQRIIKIMKAARSQNLMQFLNYSQTYFPVGRKRDMSMNVLMDPPEFLTTIHSDLKSAISKPHVDFFVNAGLKLDDQKIDWIGKGNPKIVYAIFD